MALEVKAARLANGLTLPYAEQGDVSGVPVVLVHAYVESWRYFERLLPELPRWIHAFAPSQRGHGDADRPEGGYELDLLADDVAQFLDAVGLDAAVLVGSSSGGYVAQRFAVDHPERTLGLFLAGAPRTLRDKPALSAFLEDLSRFDASVDAAFAREFVLSTLSRPLPHEFLDLLVAESAKAPPHVWREALRGLLHAEPPTETGTIDAPTVIVWGDRDAFIPRADEEALAAAIPDSRLVVYEGAGHCVLLEQPERVAAEIVSLAERFRR
jgi:non-heme chloroperoxidase